MNRLVRLGLLLAAAAAPGFPLAASIARVHLPAEREVDAARPLRLGMFAGVTGGAGTRLAELTVAGPLDPGRTRILGRARIARLAARAFPGLAIEWTGSETVRLSASGIPLDEKRVRRVLLDRLRSRAGTGWEVELEAVTLPARLLVPKGPVEVVPDSGLEPVSGTIVTRVEVRSPGGWSRRIPVRARVRIRGAMLVAARDLRPGEVVSPADVVVRRGVLPARRRVLVEPREAIGLPLRAFVRAGRPLTRRDLARMQVIEPGQPVQALLRQGAVVLRLDTVARSRGDVGDTVRVRGLDGRGLIEARVIGPGVVEILGSRRREVH